MLALRSSIVAVALTALVPAQDPTPAQRPPNIVYILADDLGYGELGCYGQTKIATPNIDALATAGMRFTQHYSGAPVCAPARCVAMTGMHSGHATIRDNFEHKPEGQKPIRNADVTVAEVLKEAGYATGCFGKWGLGFPGGEGDPLAQGFDRFYGYNCQRHAHNFYPRYLWSDREKVTLDGNDRGVTGAQYSHDLIAEQALAFIRKHRDEPFFCYVPFTIPHLALQVPEDSLAEYADRWDDPPYTGKRYLPHPKPKAAYAAMITRMDRSVGELVALLDELELADDTVVLFSSDNGATHLKQVDTEFFASGAGLRGFKGSVYEGGIRVPLVARWPGRIEAGSTTEHVSAFHDLLPTFADLAGATAPDDVDGISFAPTLVGNADDQRVHDYLFWDFPGYGGQLAVRQGKWKAVRRKLKKQPNAPLELYDLEADPAEATDVAEQHPEIVERMRTLMRTSRTEPIYDRFRFGEYGG